MWLDLKYKRERASNFNPKSALQNQGQDYHNIHVTPDKGRFLFTINNTTLGREAPNCLENESNPCFVIESSIQFNTVQNRQLKGFCGFTQDERKVCAQNASLQVTLIAIEVILEVVVAC
jgi:hypothetical protein